MILFDEANLMKINALAELARIFNQLKISIILVGTEELDNLVKRKEYIQDRFKKCYRFGVLTRGEFEQMVETLETEILQLPVPSNLAVKEILEKLYVKTSGKIRHLDWVLREAAIFSLRKGFKQVDKATLFEVLERFD
jgi:DNA transposition AAA+ family ATPase